MTTWDLKAAGINPTPAKLYDSPFSPSTSQAAQGSSRLNHSVSQYVYSANSFLKDMNTQSVPIPSKTHMLRFQLDNNALTTFIPGAVMTSQDAYVDTVKKTEHYIASFKLNNHGDFRCNQAKQEEMAAKVRRRMIGQASAIVNHKVYGTTLPSWYITQLIYLICLEQEFANEFGDETVNKNAISSPVEAANIIYDAYMTSGVATENFSAGVYQYNFNNMANALPIELVKGSYSQHELSPKDAERANELVNDISTLLSKKHATQFVEAIKPFMPIKTTNDCISVLSVIDSLWPKITAQKIFNARNNKNTLVIKELSEQLIAIATAPVIVEVPTKIDVISVVPETASADAINEVKKEVAVNSVAKEIKEENPTASDEEITLASVEVVTPEAVANAPVVKPSCLEKIIAVDRLVEETLNTRIYNIKKENWKNSLFTQSLKQKDQNDLYKKSQEMINLKEKISKRPDGETKAKLIRDQVILQAEIDELDYRIKSKLASMDEYERDAEKRRQKNHGALQIGTVMYTTPEGGEFRSEARLVSYPFNNGNTSSLTYINRGKEQKEQKKEPWINHSTIGGHVPKWQGMQGRMRNVRHSISGVEHFSASSCGWTIAILVIVVIVLAMFLYKMICDKKGWKPFWTKIHNKIKAKKAASV